LASNDDRPEIRALAELEAVIAAVTQEVAAWRRRALKAEAGRSGGGASPDLASARERIQELEDENVELQHRLRTARERTEQLLGRLQFLEEQVGLESPPR
jgi:predicted  nucleic acid-binding Zn-ribbon protein